MSDSEPADPFSDHERHPYSSALDEARMLRHAIEDAADLEGLLRALIALTDEELRWIVFEIGLDALWERRNPGG